MKRYPTWDAVLGYCVYSANPVGRLVLYLCGYRDEERQRHSDATCTALQLANFWQDVSRDSEIGRIYIPLDVAAAHGLSEAEIVGRRFDERYVASDERSDRTHASAFSPGHAARENGGRQDQRGPGNVQPRRPGGAGCHRSDGLRHTPPAPGSGQSEAGEPAGTRAGYACVRSAPKRTAKFGFAREGAKFVGRGKLRQAERLSASYSHCHHIARAAHSNFYYAFFLLPKAKRDGIWPPLCVHAAGRRCVRRRRGRGRQAARAGQMARRARRSGDRPSAGFDGNARCRSRRRFARPAEVLPALVDTMQPVSDARALSPRSDQRRGDGPDDPGRTRRSSACANIVTAWPARLA